MYLLWSGSRGLCWGFRGRSFVLLALTESLRTPAACWTVRNASRVGTQTRSHAFCAALNGRQKPASPSGRTGGGSAQTTVGGKSGGMWSPKFLRRTVLGWFREVM